MYVPGKKVHKWLDEHAAKDGIHYMCVIPDDKDVKPYIVVVAVGVYAIDVLGYLKEFYRVDVVACPKCKKEGMTRHGNVWVCPHCGHREEDVNGLPKSMAEDDEEFIREIGNRRVL